MWVSNWSSKKDKFLLNILSHINETQKRKESEALFPTSCGETDQSTIEGNLTMIESSIQIDT